MNMPLSEFIEYVEDLGDEAERIRKQQEKEAGRNGQ
jgi:hypothetical protein